MIIIYKKNKRKTKRNINFYKNEIINNKNLNVSLVKREENNNKKKKEV